MIRNILLSTMLSLRAHKLRVFLTMVGIIIGIASVVTIAALGEGVKQQSMELANTTEANVVTVKHTIAMSDNSGMGYVEDDFSFFKSGYATDFPVGWRSVGCTRLWFKWYGDGLD